MNYVQNYEQVHFKKQLLVLHTCDYLQVTYWTQKNEMKKIISGMYNYMIMYLHQLKSDQYIISSLYFGIIWMFLIKNVTLSYQLTLLNSYHFFIARFQGRMMIFLLLFSRTF